MEKLNDLVALAEKADAVANLIDGVNPHTILAVAEAFRALEIEKNQAQGFLEMLRSDYKEMQQRAEAAEAKLAEYEADISKVHSVGRKHGLASMQNGYLVATALAERPAPAADLAELVPPMKDDSIPGKNDSYIDMCDGWNACRAAMLRKIEEAK